MKNKKSSYATFQNVIVFPGTVERLFSEALKYMKTNQFEKANRYFEEALQYTEGDEHLLSIYAYSLYESKSYEKAKEVCEKLLNLGPAMYFEIMELYLTVCMQLKEYKKVERIISSLFDEGAIPQEKMEQFKRLKELNANISERMEKQDDHPAAVKQYEPEMFELDAFLSLEPNEQVKKLNELALINIRPILPQLKRIVEHDRIHPFVKSLILILMNEQAVDMEIKIGKFDRIIVVNPSKIGLPTELPQYKMISNIVNDQLQQEPSILEMVEYLIAKHSIVTYPFEWLDFQPQDVAQCYIDFVHQMFGQQRGANQEIFHFIQELEMLSELQ
ncbi:MAG: hypothetical protein C0P75_011730 [Bacilli bacterium]|uniref:Tetratricopeptide repeat protein n=1 Tax=Ureibacillus suwonensis TaxID=313007 RepID=A0ABW0RBW6_9BACL|nr:hypothetical protein [Bacilli bacterium]